MSNSGAATTNRLIKLNVGGKLFQTTSGTLLSPGPDSLLAALSNRNTNNNDQDSEEEEEFRDDTDPEPIFIDRDPEIFAILLSLLRSNRLPSNSLSKQDLFEEAQYYGIENILKSALSPPPLLGFDASLASTIRPASDAFPSALSANNPDDGSVWIAHGGQISSYDWNLSHVSTVRTHLDDITSIARVWPELAAVAALESPGLHFYDVSIGRHVGSTHWSDPTDPRIYKARVTAIAADLNPSYPVYAAFECPHKENSILSIDRSTTKIMSEIGRQGGSSMKVAAATKLTHLTEMGVLFASSVSSGAFGYSGYMKVWDPRSGDGVWETTEPGGAGRSSRFGDSFSGVDVDGEEMKIYKVCWKSGDIGMADMRMLSEDPWVYLEDLRSRGGLRKDGCGDGSVVCCYRKQVFVSREDGLEVWSRIGKEDEEVEEGKRYSRNYVDKEEDAKRGRIMMMEGGGERLFVSREEMEGVEVWETSNLSGVISLL